MAILRQKRNRLCRIGNKEIMIKDCKSVHNIPTCNTTYINNTTYHFLRRLRMDRSGPAGMKMNNAFRTSLLGFEFDDNENEVETGILL